VALMWLWAEAAGWLMERWGRVGWRELTWRWRGCGCGLGLQTRCWNQP